MEKNILSVLILTLFITITPTKADVSPCENPYAPSYTVCENNHCTTYCNTPIPATMTTIPRRTYQYSVYSPYGSFNISNEFVGLNIVTRPLVYHHMPPRYHVYPNHRPPMHHYQRPLRPARPAKPVSTIRIRKN